MKKISIYLVIILISLFIINLAACEPGISDNTEVTYSPTAVAAESVDLEIDPIPDDIDTNIPKISGIVSDPSATVYVNNKQALILEDGSFFTYIEIPPRVPAVIEVRAESSGPIASKSFTTTFYPEPFIWPLKTTDTRSDRAVMEGWVSYPDARIIITGDLIDPVVEIQEDGFFIATFSLSGGFQYQESGTTYYNIELSAVTSRGTTNTFKETTPMNSAGGTSFVLDDYPAYTRKVYVERGETVAYEREFQYYVSSPTLNNLKLVPDTDEGTTSEHLRVKIEPESFLAYPAAPRKSTIIISADKETPSGSYFFRANRGDHLEVIVE